MARERKDKGFNSGLGPRTSGLSFGWWFRRSRLEKAAAIVLLLSLLVDTVAAESLPRVATVLHFLTAGCFLALLFRYVRSLLSLAIWRLRNRLLIAYLFIAVVPVALIAGMAGISLYIFYGLTSTYMASSEVHRLEEELALAGRTIALNVASKRDNLETVFNAHLSPKLKGVHPEAHLLPPGDVAPWFQKALVD